MTTGRRRDVTSLVISLAVILSVAALLGCQAGSVSPGLSDDGKRQELRR